MHIPTGTDDDTVKEFVSLLEDYNGYQIGVILNRAILDLMSYDYPDRLDTAQTLKIFAEKTGDNAHGDLLIALAKLIEETPKP